ncbi:type VI secretion system lipoprotein TssJ [Pseudomonas gessardii]|uniref:type VI secretion system lipoprotein TssJ n=1 Tax=Pseudomonas gessardii TaxID=78544 RepID=UPI001475CB54|nr:type VI secretion system lipoprotein TssJ [Pseudomonas gessardii]NNA67829.1 type VI secretion system lipoprotein TssJ [Pseudomonas gessardii]NNA88166.1 type VI secretion system lipoprotein TssJ [Pseudomonas gessardii]
MPRATSVLLLAVMGLLPGCSNLSPYSTLTKLDLTLTASDRVNPDVNGRPSPIVVRLLELRNPVAFENADFFSLYGRAENTLPKDLVSSEEWELRPGEQVALKLRATPGSRYLGVLAAYRDLPQARWRHVVPLAVESRTQVDLLLDEAGVRAMALQTAKAGD